MAYSAMSKRTVTSVLFFFFLTLTRVQCLTPWRLFDLVGPETPVLKYHNGPLLRGNVTVNLVWYGKFSPSQRAVLVDFLRSLSPSAGRHPSASSWWQTTRAYTGTPSTLFIGRQIFDEKCSSGKHLSAGRLAAVASKGGGGHNVVSIVLTAEDVTVAGFCMSRCGTHRSMRGRKGRGRVVYAWVGNAVSQCPGECAWPFHRPVYGPQTAPLVAPNGDVGIDGMVINLATVLAGTVTNPYGNGYFQGEAGAPLESVSACTGIFGAGAYPGYPGDVLVDRVTGAGYNAVGLNGRKYLLPAMWDPQSSTCKTPV